LHGSDWWYELVRLAEYTHVLGQGAFPVRWSPDLHGGYGSPIFVFYPPVFLTMAGALALSGMTFAAAAKAALFLLTLAAGLGMYLFARELFGERGGMLAAYLYVLAPYRFIDAFVRNAFAEFTAMSVAPFVFYGITRILNGRGSLRGAQAVMALSAALFVLSHNLSVVMYLPVILLYAVVFAAFGGGLKRLGRLAAPLAVSVLLSAYYVLPVIFEMKHIQLWRATTGKFYLLFNLVAPGSLVSWTSWYSVTPFSLALAVFSIAAITLRRKEIERPVLGALAVFAILIACYTALMTPVGTPLWKSAGFLGILQFPWRLLSPATFMLSTLGGAILYLAGKTPRLKAARAVEIAAVAAAFLIAWYPFWTAKYVAVYDEALSAESIRINKHSATVTGEYLPVTVRRNVPASPRAEFVEVAGPGGRAEALRKGPESFAYRVVLSGESSVLVNVFYFPGWKLYADGRPADFEVTPQGLMRFTLPAGEHLVEAGFEDTPVRSASQALSLAGLLGLLWLSASAAFSRRKGRRAGGPGGRDGV
jgi:hypothetical protein